MIDYMDEIVEAVKEFSEVMKDAAATLLVIVANILLLITAWTGVLPYEIFRVLQKDNNGGRCEKPDCKNCPFPPCDERSGRK